MNVTVAIGYKALYNREYGLQLLEAVNFDINMKLVALPRHDTAE